MIKKKDFFKSFFLELGIIGRQSRTRERYFRHTVSVSFSFFFGVDDRAVPPIERVRLGVGAITADKDAGNTRVVHRER